MENGFVAWENCFIGTCRRNNSNKKSNNFSSAPPDHLDQGALSGPCCGHDSRREGSGRLARQHFSISLFEARWPGIIEPGLRRRRLNVTHATFLCSRALLHPSSTRIAVLGNGNLGDGNTDIGSKTPIRQSRQPFIESSASGFSDLRIGGQDGLKLEPVRKCGAMSEQSADSGRGNEQVPQKLVHLVGYRDPNAGPDPWIRPRPIPAKP
jgi:hypothetical protein